MRADSLGEFGEFLNRIAVGKEAAQEVEALDEPCQQVDERLALFVIGNGRLESHTQILHRGLDSGVLSTTQQHGEIPRIFLRENPGGQ